MKVNILQFENAVLQELHAKAATVANAAVTHGPFVGGWWEQYLAVVIETAQAEQRVACSKDVAEIRNFCDLLAKDLDAVTKERDDLQNALSLSTTRENEAWETITALRAAAQFAPAAPPHEKLDEEPGNVVAAPVQPLHDNPVTYTARSNPFLPK